MTWTQPPRIGEIAFHEAGHAAAAYALRRQIEKASINPHDRNAPSISLTTLGSRHLKRRGRNAVIALAGAAAERSTGVASTTDSAQTTISGTRVNCSKNSPSFEEKTPTWS
jgi:ATP-dependent Zn protease